MKLQNKQQTRTWVPICLKDWFVKLVSAARFFGCGWGPMTTLAAFSIDWPGLFAEEEEEEAEKRRFCVDI